MKHEIVRLGLLVSGTVQGVGFRWFAAKTAELLSLTGFAQNLSDGSVWVEIQGEKSAVEDYLHRIEAGRGFIEVTDIRQKSLPLRDEYGFLCD